ncbi:MAG TPA: heme exporter protein CcmB [Chloroflexota bacterium]|nr:heme exporter protein CcmB [Chloroflexota bacterium]
MPAFLDVVGTLVWKDLLSESRTKDVLSTGVAFALLVLVMLNFAIDLGAENVEAVAPGVLWVSFIFAGTLGIGHAFAAERDRGTFEGLLLAPIDRGAIYLAKVATNVALMGIVELVSLPIFAVLYNVSPAWLQTLSAMALGTIGFSAVGTLVAAIAANTRARELMLPLLLFPLEVPVVIASVKATAAAMGAAEADSLPWLQLLVGFDVMLVAASFLVFEYVVEE